jgi:hypothetical protein
MTRHDFDPLSLVAGVLFAGLGIASLAGSVDYLDVDLSWVWPLTIVALGLALLAGSVAKSRPEATDAPAPRQEDSASRTDDEHADSTREDNEI